MIGNLANENISLLNKFPQVTIVKRSRVKVWNATVGDYEYTVTDSNFLANLVNITTELISSFDSIGIKITDSSKRIRTLQNLNVDDLVVIGSVEHRITYKQEKQGYYIYLLDVKK